MCSPRGYPALFMSTVAAQPAEEQTDHPLVEVRDLHVQFGRQPVLRGINLRVPRGQTLVILGESGCGKTVLLKCLIGLIRPTSGSVIFAERDLSRLSERELAQLRVRYGFLFQGAALFDSLTVAENIAFPLREHTRKSSAEIAAIVRQLVAVVGLGEATLTKYPAELSGGMRKRVGLARALTLNPDLMLYDEPTTGLDPIMSDVINELIIRARQQHPLTSIVVTHDMHTAAKVPDRVVMLYPLARLGAGEPQVIYDGPPRDMARCRDRRVTQFIKGEAGERLQEMHLEQASADSLLRGVAR
ncbi:MAG: ABC transporter ATP-binding protein [Pirellulales bacterium]|nr:ABC transporter ATP-binding protein [Pirellulales bacterium]